MSFPGKYNMHSVGKSHIRSVALENFEDQWKLNTQHPGKIQTYIFVHNFKDLWLLFSPAMDKWTSK